MDYLDPRTRVLLHLRFGINLKGIDLKAQGSICHIIKALNKSVLSLFLFLLSIFILYFTDGDGELKYG